jgi:two-component system, OmpR family, response regulator
MEKKKASFIQVYCPELMAMINPGEWTDCPFFKGQKLDLSNAEKALKQIFRCHVQCDSKIQYQFYEGGKLVEKVEEAVEDQDSLRRILSLVMKQSKKTDQKREKKVLIVDDDVDFLEMHAAVLKNRGYGVATAKSSKECLDKLSKSRPDVVVLDVMMEQFDSGFKLSKKIKGKYRDLPVMLLTSIGAQTGLEFSSNEEVLRATGADILLDKPVSPKVFTDEIEKLTSAKRKS